MIKRCTPFLFLLALFLGLPLPTLSATLYIDPGIATLSRGDTLTAAVRIMPDGETGECVNTIDAVVTYSANLQPVDVSIGKSIFSVWVESPVINKDERTITFAGGIPNGYCGRVEGDPRLTNIIAEIIFRSPGLQIGGGDDSGIANIDFTPETQILLNDGQGTRAPLQLLGSTITLEKNAGPVLIDPWRQEVQADEIPPEEFSITLTNDTSAFSGKHFIVFDSSDKQTGISHYEVMEESVQEFATFKWGGVGVPWIRSTSPYVLKDQSLNSIIRVKAVDKAGNEYIATLIPDASMQTMSRNTLLNYILLGALSVLLLIVVIVVVVLGLRRKKRRMAKAEDEEIIV